MKFHVVLVLCALASVSIPLTNGFNVETQHYTIYRKEQRDSMFGFSVAEHLDNTYRGWVIVGAPQAQTEQTGVYQGGSVYRCDIYQDDGCSPIYFDTEGDKINYYEPGLPTQVENKTLQWFGASVSTSQIADGPILACAPRYVWFSTGSVRREPIGTCYITRNSFREPKEFSPCRTRHWGYHRQGSCQAGLGAALSKNGERVFIGAPGSYYWQGQAYSVDSKAEFPYIPPRFSYFGGVTGQAISASTETLPVAAFTTEGQAIDDDSYLGYSVATGDFEGKGEIGAAVGMPRGNNLQGKVVLLRTNMTFYNKNLTGVQMGAYFGYSVISCDVDGDGLDDLVVGAPMYTVEDNPEMTFETGRVHIFYQGSGAEKFTRSETRDGVENRGRFGLSLASLKDINRDGYQDFAVGAPYGGPDGRGAVYVFYGSQNGVLEKYSQAIYAQQMQVPMSTFGFSIAGGLDLDGNQYPDIVVGAYDSSAAAFFRARPVFDMKGTVTFESTTKFISLEEKNCTLNDGSRAPCLPLDTCLTFTGLGVGQRYEFNVQYLLDVKKSKNPRLFFVDYENQNSINQTVRLERGKQLCRRFRVYVSPNIRDKLTSLEAEMRMSLVEDKAAAAALRNPREQLIPVLGASSLQSNSLTIFKKCGPDNVCIPNLQLIVEPSVKKYLLGSGEKLHLDVLVQNTGENAFEAMFHLKLPTGISYVNIELIDKTGIPVQCSAPQLSNNYTLRCDIGNPLPENSNVHFKVFLQPVTSQGMDASYEMEMTVNTTNPEDSETQADNSYHLSLPIWIQTELFIEGKSRPKEIFYNFENYTSENITHELQFGPVFTHNYTIRNDGPSNIVEAEAFLIWPAQTLAGEELVYLMEDPQVSGKAIRCQPANANYLSLELENRRGSYQSAYGGYSGLSSADRKNQMAEDARLKQQNETSYSQSGIKDYDYGSEFVFSNSSSRNFSSSGGFSRNFTVSESSSTSTGQKGNFVSQQGSGQVGGVLLPGPEIITEIYNGALEATISPSIRLPSRTGGGGQVTDSGAGATFGQTDYEKSWNRSGVFHHGWSTAGGSTGENGIAVDAQRGGSSGTTYIGEERQQNWNAANAQGGGFSGTTQTEEERRNWDTANAQGGGSSGGTYTEERQRNWSAANAQGGGSLGATQTEEERRNWDTANAQGGGLSGATYTEERQRNWSAANAQGGGSSAATQTEEERRNWDTANAHRGGFSGATYTEERQRNWSAANSQGGGSSGAAQTEEERRNWNRANAQGGGSSGATYTEEHQRNWSAANAQGGGSSGATRTEEERRNWETANAQNRGSSGATYTEEHQRNWSAANTQSGGPSGATYTEQVNDHEAERKQHEQEWSRQQEERWLELERQRTSTNQRVGVEPPSYGIEKHFVTNSESSQSIGQTSRGSTSGLNFHLSNIGLPQDLEKFFSSMSTDAGSITTHSKDGKDFVLFDGRFRVGGNKEYIEFKNGQVFELMDRNGQPSLNTGRRLSEQFVRFEGQLLGGVEDGSIFIELEDGRRFKVPGIYSYQRKETYTVGGGPHERVTSESKVIYGKQVIHNGGEVSGRDFEPYENNWREESSYQKNWRSGKTISKKYESTGETFYGDNVPTERPDNRASRYPRESDTLDVGQFRKWEKKHRRGRDVASASSSEKNKHSRSLEDTIFGSSEGSEGTGCNSATCVSIQCTVGPLAKDEEVWISMRARVKAKTLNEIGFNDDVTVSTQLVARVTRQPFISGTPTEQVTKSYEIHTTIHPSAPPTAPDVIPLWVVVLSACAGTIILLLLIFLLYKCGFFKRNRPTDAAERQPLNRNGHYQD